jgi:antitoxin CptB
LSDSINPAGSDPALAQLRWRCRRGMGELDRLLTGFLSSAYAALDSGEKQRFADLLDLPDPELYAYLLGRQQPQSAELVHLLERFRACGAAKA